LPLVVVVLVVVLVVVDVDDGVVAGNDDAIGLGIVVGVVVRLVLVLDSGE